MQNQTTDGPVVYFIQPAWGGPIKIGFCTRRSLVPDRMKMLQTGHPYPLVVRKLIDARGRQDEYELHAKFGAYRLAGEWFLDVPEVAMEAGVALPDRLDEARLLRPLLEKAFQAGRVQGQEETELQTRLLLKEFFERTVPWMFGEETELHESLEASYIDLALDEIVNIQEKAQIRTAHAAWIRHATEKRLRDGAATVPSARNAEAESDV